ARGRLGMLLRGFGIEEGAESEADIDLHEGGPVERDRVMVLHSPDYRRNDSMVGGHAVLTESLEVLRDMAAGQGPLHSIVMLGYAGWGPDQLESEIARGSWLTVEADEDLLFDDVIDTKWQRAIARHGFDL
ncbi:MAG: YqgE/AlgH family protein, partial [Pseudomonadota bacterium]